MGWERKRGKLVEFNAYLRGEADGAFAITEGDLPWLAGVRYVITLDADTILPRGAAAATSSDASGDRIRDTLERFDTALIRFGVFASDGVNSFLSEEPGELPVLLVASELEAMPHQVFAATWELVGAHRDLWANYASALRQGTATQFLAERGVTSADAREVETLVEASGETRFESAKPLVLALGLAHGVVNDHEAFQAAWPDHSRSADALARWVGQPGLADALALAAVMEGQERTILRVLEASHISTEEWQRARKALGLPVHLFEYSREKYLRARETVAAALMATAAHATSVDLDDARSVVERIRVLEPPAELLEALKSEREMVSEVLALTDGFFGESIGGTNVLRARVQEGIVAGREGARDALLMRVAHREVEEYRLPEGMRAASASRDAEIILNAAVRLAPRLGEIVAADAVLAEERVAALRAGWWANRFAMLDPLRYALASQAPETTRRLSEERAFRDPGPPGALIARIGELREPDGSSGTPMSPPRILSVAGLSLAATELEADLSRGSDGRIGAEVRRHLPAELEFDALRQLALPTVHRRSRRGGRGTRTGASREPMETDSDQQLNGLLGEAFVYELFREQLPGFDFQCWKSGNSLRYGVASEYNDALGADFLYHDVSGMLSGRTDAPEVYLEVKATSEEGSAPFELSANEWETALRISLENTNRVYVILRVARVRTAPKLHRIFVDPVQLKRDGFLLIEDADLRVYGC